jgi:conjugation system TraG family ATPase
MSKGSAENTVNAEGIARFIDMIHAEATVAVYTHMNILSWGPREEEPAMRGAVGAALSAMGLTGRLNTVDTPELWLAGMPGGAMEIGEDNLFIAELEQAMCLSIGESYMRDFPGGKLRITDRHRHTPVLLDTQEGAYQAKYIENYNAFILGPSGSGKSFFTNWYVRNCFDAGQHVFIIDKGDSYEGLCALIREETGGRDGVYYSWSAEHPFAFAPLAGCREWDAETDGAQGMGFFVSLLKIIWSPRGGWDSASDAVLFRIISDFVASLPADGEDPVFEDFLRYLREEVRPRILREGDAAPEPYTVGGVEVTAAVLDIRSMCIALDPYGRGGRFGFLLNEPRPADLFASRFVVFEVDVLSETDPTLYALCTFCIIRAFERKMRSDSEAFRLLFIEEAWQAIATEGTADYLRGLWKTARKYHTSATVVTQQVSDIISSPVIKDAILSNSPVKILLDQRSNAASFGEIASLLGLSPIDQALVRSVGRDLPEDARYREVFITLGGKRSGVYALEVSPEEALVYESDKVRKRPLLEKARELGSIRRAVLSLTRQKNTDR